MQSPKISIFSDGQSILQELQKSRPGVPSDLDDVVERARSFHAQSLWKDAEFDTNQVSGLVGSLLEYGGIFINSCGGFIAGTMAPLLFNPNVLIATELAWYAPNGGGRQLRESFEAWGREEGATMIQFCALASENFDEVHKNMNTNGFALAELNYVKVV